MTEAEVRASLRGELLASRPHSEVIYEFWIPRSHERADVTVIGASLEAFEIKTDRDSLKRLPRQVEAYSRVFDRCSAVLASRHIARAGEVLPPWWGVIVIEEGLTFEALRDPGPNPDIDITTLVRLLWRSEVYGVLGELGRDPSPKASRFRLWEELMANLDLEALKRVVREVLARRDSSQARIPSKRFAIS